MKKREQSDQYGFFYDEDGTNQVSQQIMDSYNSGVIDSTENDEIQSEGKTEF
ncbi:MAG TPA: hypothetical protein VK190_01855 [Pseudoneobacillus sp.]|nr:hypothetical protein [Pseudoneobacillus sp.]